MNFAEWLYENEYDPFQIAMDIGESELEKLKNKWRKESGIKEDSDTVFEKLSNLNFTVDNDRLVRVITKMTDKDKNQTNYVGSWIYNCLVNNKEKALKAKDRVSEKYQKTIEKHIDSFINMLIKK